MKQIAYQRRQPVGVDIAREPISREMKTCILTEHFARPGSHIVKHNGVLFLRHGRFEFLCTRLCH